MAALVLAGIGPGPVRAGIEPPSPAPTSENAEAGAEADGEGGEGVVAPGAAPGDPSETDDSSDGGSAATPGPSNTDGAEAGVAPLSDAMVPGASSPPLWLGALVLGVHVVWAGIAGAWLWRRRRAALTPDPAFSSEDPRAAASLGLTLVIAAMLVWLSLALGAGSARVLLRLEGPDLATMRGQALSLLGGYTGGALAFGFVVLMAPAALRALGRRPGVRDLTSAAIAYALAHPFVWLTGVAGAWVARLVTPADRAIDPLAHDTLRTLADEPIGGWWVALVLSAVVGAPIIEELIYRGLLQNGIARLTRAPLLPVVATSALFALIHVESVRPHALPTLFVLSLAFGLAYSKTGRLGVPILMHMAFNALNVALALASFG